MIEINPKISKPPDELHELKKSNETFMMEDLPFETLKQFSKYYAHNNVDEVLNKINKSNYNRLKRKGKSHLFSVKTESEFIRTSSRRFVKNQMWKNSIFKEGGEFNDWRNILKNQKLERKKIEVKKKNFLIFLMNCIKILFKSSKNTGK